ncbi:MAG: hypothetical protein CL389_11635 [Acidiferrobacteraceae bacterium]|jgi:L-alanine-DL-glutamate epimerase-like enolase superfamily enzyme|nr:hypothetical protein [Acidiferrobacteraceae bacterium]MDP6399585.1 hypothetical protein [Arenicellales bacterium]MDP6552887.1 hypothetical protein [Arenicellales bacterium]MDP6791039.1 hypothetical protein [Arenicellales bacterium]MDP6919047.1 hypothetical protein [Arenicellales bacterium]|tara:strand:+ start:942 stop:1214 length:273 start_codon:yes stop_codon:yes gene_type:complete
MKITNIKTFIVPAHVSDSDWAFGRAFVLVKVETDENHFGWGEGYVPNDCEHAISASMPLKHQKRRARGAKKINQQETPVSLYRGATRAIH